MNRLSICLSSRGSAGPRRGPSGRDKARATSRKATPTAKNIPALPWQEVPALLPELSTAGVASQSWPLRLLILTAVRFLFPSASFTRSQIEGDVWTIPQRSYEGARRGDFGLAGCRSPARRWRSSKRPVPFARDGFAVPRCEEGRDSDMTMSGLMARRRHGREPPHASVSPSATGWPKRRTRPRTRCRGQRWATIVGGSLERSYRPPRTFWNKRRALMEAVGRTDFGSLQLASSCYFSG